MFMFVCVFLCISTSIYVCALVCVEMLGHVHSKYSGHCLLHAYLDCL